MMNFKNNKGITLIMLIVTIIIILITAGITIELSIDSVEQTTDSQDISEMLIIQHAIQERYLEYTQTNNASILVGTMNNPSANPNEDEYYEYKLNSKQNLEDLGVTGEGVTDSKYVVNYKTGYVEKEGSSEPSLSGYNQDAGGNPTSFEVNITN